MKSTRGIVENPVSQRSGGSLNKIETTYDTAINEKRIRRSLPFRFDPSLSILTSSAITSNVNRISFTESVILHSRDVLRWLYYREFGKDCGPVDKDSPFGQELSASYHTEFWNSNTFKGKDATKIKTRLKQVRRWAEPFLAYLRNNRS